MWRLRQAMQDARERCDARCPIQASVYASRALRPESTFVSLVWKYSFVTVPRSDTSVTTGRCTCTNEWVLHLQQPTCISGSTVSSNMNTDVPGAVWPDAVSIGAPQAVLTFAGTSSRVGVCCICCTTSTAVGLRPLFLVGFEGELASWKRYKYLPLRALLLHAVLFWG